jgi:hypothetical protein
VSSAAIVAAVAGVASAGMGAMGAAQQASQARSQANYKAQVANNNAIIAQQNAVRLQQYGSIAEDEQRERLAQTRGAARARLAANGLLVDDSIDSTAALLQTDLDVEGEYDILKLKDRYAQQIRAAQIQGVNFQAEAGLASLQAAQQKPGFSALGSLLSNAGSVASGFKGLSGGGGGLVGNDRGFQVTP